MGVPNANPCSNFDVKLGLRSDFTSKVEHGLTFGTPKFAIVPYDKINHTIVNLSYNCDVKSGLRHDFMSQLQLSLTSPLFILS